MKNMTITLDLKSLCLGALGVFCIVALSNFNRPAPQPNDATDEVRRYQAVSGERGLIILDTKTGKFLLDVNYIGRARWQKGDFETMQNDKTPRTE